MTSPEFLTIAEVAAMLRSSEEGVKGLIAGGLLAAVDLGGEEGYRISREDLQQFLKGQKELVRSAADRELRSTWVTRRSLSLFADWVQKENHGVVGYYQGFEEAIDRAIYRLQEDLNKAVNTGDNIRARSLHRALEVIYGKWERPRKNFHRWLLGQEKRWLLFRQGRDSGRRAKLTFGPFLKELEEAVQAEPVPPMALARGLSRAKEDISATESMVRWHHEEQELLQEHYETLERNFQRACEKLREEARDASKDLDLISSQVYYEARRLLYREWEKVSQHFNTWLLRRPERWRGYIDDVLRGAPSPWPAGPDLPGPGGEGGDMGGEE